MSAIAAQRFIADAHKNKATVLTTLTKVFTHQKILVELKAPDIVSEQYNDIVTDIGEMINYIERGKMSDVSENLVELKGDMALVEINTLKKVNLDLADNFLDKAKDIDNYTREIITKAGYGKYFVHSTGHGVGLDIHEYPFINSKSDIVIEDNMVFTIEPGIYLPNEFGVRIEDTIAMINGRAVIL